MKRFGFIIFLCLVIDLSMAQPRHSALTNLPATAVFDLNGATTTLAAMGKNKVTIIDNWFIPCPPCFKEMGMLHELYEKYRLNSRVNFMTLCETDPVIVKQFLAKDTAVKRYTAMYFQFSELPDFKLPVYFIKGCNMKIYTGKTLANYAPDDKSKCPDALFHFKGYPPIIIFDKNGKLIFKKTGYADGEATTYKAKLEKIIDAALANTR